MNRIRTRILVAVSLALIAGTALLLARFQSAHRLGQPGLKLADLPLMDEEGQPATTNSIYLPETVLDYRSELLPVTREELDWLPADTTFGRRMYRSESDGFLAQISGVLMGTDRTSIHKPEYCLPGQGFQIHRRSREFIEIERPHRYRLPVMRLDALRELRQPNGRSDRWGAVYVYWFVSDSRLSNDHFERMWWLAADLVRTGELQRWAYIGCLGICPPGEEDATYERLSRLIQATVPEFQETVGPAPAGAANLPTGVLGLVAPAGRMGLLNVPSDIAALNSPGLVR